MNISEKYGRTYHYPFSPGTTSDDRINYDYWQDIQQIPTMIHTEKLDGENNCLNRYGVFARSHAAPTISPWTQHLRQRWESIRHDLGDLELFGENLYAVHSIQYRQLEHHFFALAIRYLDTWLSWEEVAFYAALFDFPTVPVLEAVPVQAGLTEAAFRQQVLSWVHQPSRFESYDPAQNIPCTMEGLVSRNAGEYAVADMPHHVFKYVRKGHVQTDQHWTRNWKRAMLKWEYAKE
jgi:RNA ligase